MMKAFRNLTQTRRDLAIGIGTMIVVIVAALAASESVVDFLCRTVIYMLFATAVNIILGFGGLRPLGQGMYFGFSSYAYLFLVVRAKMSLAPALLLAILMTVALAAFVGYLCLRSNDDLAFAFMNLGLNTLIWTMVQKMQVVGSDTGITGSVRLPFAQDTRSNFWLCFSVCVVCIALIYAFQRSPFARVLKGSRENLERLTFIGINTRNVRLVSYIVSGFFCGIAGLLYAMRNMGAFPSMISSNASLDALIMCLIGGMYSFFGPMLGAAVVTVINVQLPILTNYYQAIAGVIIVLCVLFLQGGVLKDKATLELETVARRGASTARKGGI